MLEQLHGNPCFWGILEMRVPIGNIGVLHRQLRDFFGMIVRE